jgi:hypothetical protein
VSWLKFDTDTPEKPEVLAITAAMGWADPDLTVGKLFKVWRWFDKQTIDGNARSVTPALLDHVIGVTGFSEAMAAAGWLDVSDAGLTLPKFDRHNGQTAKDRALTAQRVAKSKQKSRAGNATGNASTVTASVTGALPREEKRREETATAGNETISLSPADAAEGSTAGTDLVGSFEGRDDRPTSPEVRARLDVIAKARALGCGDGLTAKDLDPYIAAGGTAAHFAEVAGWSGCAGKGGKYVLRAACSNLAENPPQVANGTAVAVIDGTRPQFTAPTSKRSQALQLLEGMKRGNR